MNDGGPAFPPYGYAERGMSLRAWFAGQIVANPNLVDGPEDFDNVDTIEWIYKKAQALVDEELRLRQVATNRKDRAR